MGRNTYECHWQQRRIAKAPTTSHLHWANRPLDLLSGSRDSLGLCDIDGSTQILKVLIMSAPIGCWMGHDNLLTLPEGWLVADMTVDIQLR
jgi:hypothetical protein